MKNQKQVVQFKLIASLFSPYFLLTVYCFLLGVTTQTAVAQSISISYPNNQVYTVGTPISTLSPTVTGGPAASGGQTTITYAGNGATGVNNGPALSASFVNPLATAVDNQGNVYVADSDNDLIRKITPAGMVSTLAGGNGYTFTDGLGTAAGFKHPAGLAVDAAGNIFVADQQNHAIRKITPVGMVTTFAGTGSAGSTNGTGTSASFNNPIGLAFDAAGNLYVGDYSNHKIRKITPAGVVTTFAGTGTAGATNGTASSATFRNPMGLAFDGSGNLYVADRVNHMIRKITAGGTVSTLAGSGSIGSTNATGTAASFNYPNSVAVDISSNVFVVDYLNNMIRKVTAAGVVSTFAGTLTAGTINGTGSVVQFSGPYGLSLDNRGNIILAESTVHLVRKVVTRPFTVSPELPAGLVFNDTNGTISGTPLASVPATVYTITAYNPTHASNDFALTLTVDPTPSLQGSADQNYVITAVVKKPGVTNASQLPALANHEVNHAIQYLDGLGNPLQNVLCKASPLTNDIVQPYVYDAFGREETQYKPYAEQSGNGLYKSNALTRQGQYYGVSSWDSHVAKTIAPFSKTVFEASPLNRIKEQGGAGSVWQPAGSRTTTQGRTTVTEYGSNNSSTAYTTTGYAVRLWMAVPVSGADFQRNLSTNGFYAAGELGLRISKNADWTAADGKAGTVEEYVDKEGRILMKRVFNTAGQVLSTYYVYDDLGQLSFILPPGVDPDGTSINQTTLDQYCTQFRYDEKRRLIEKRNPAVDGWSHQIYNVLDQVVFTQDANQAVFSPAPRRSFIKYDGQGRVIMQGIEENHTSDRVTVQGTVNTYFPVNWEVRDASGSNYHGYTNVSCPDYVPNMNVEVVNYYDTYQDIPGLPDNQSASFSNKTQGLMTASKTKVLGTNDFLWTVYYYDEENRLARRYKQHYQTGAIDAGNYDEYHYSYNFADEVTAISRVHHKTGVANTTIANRYEYDHAGRPLRNYEKINTDTEVLLSENTYNEIGEQKSKALHNGLQTTIYSYTEKGWLKNQSSGQFSYELQYQDGSTPLYSGNISGQLWGAGSTLGSSFVYSYDKIGRLTSGVGTGMSESLTYDVSGNIQTLNRDGITRNYFYTANRVNNTTGAPGTGTYQYDANGNTIYDGRLGQAITVNQLNLPSAIAGLGVSYVYDAEGNKLRKTSSGVVTDYVDGIQYSAGSISFIQTEEGIARRNGSSYTYEYDLTDHLGNVRYTFYRNPVTGLAERLQSDDYYPFGLRKSGSPVSLNNKYLYVGKEIQDELEQYDYGARFYDPVLARWPARDPADQFADITPYGAMANNPILYNDPDGRALPAFVVGALIGGAINLISNYAAHDGKITFKQGVMAFATGAVAGAVAVAGGQFALQAAGMTISQGGFAASAISGLGGSFFASPILGYGNNKTFGTPYGASQFAAEVGLSTATAGVAGGVTSWLNGGNFWRGRIATVSAGPVEQVQFGDRVIKTPETESLDKTYNELNDAAKLIYPNKANVIELHHITPKYLGGAANGPLVPLNGAYHQQITNEFRSLWGYGQNYPDQRQLNEIMQKVYVKYPLPKGFRIF